MIFHIIFFIDYFTLVSVTFWSLFPTGIELLRKQRNIRKKRFYWKKWATSVLNLPLKRIPFSYQKNSGNTFRFYKQELKNRLKITAANKVLTISHSSALFSAHAWILPNIRRIFFSLLCTSRLIRQRWLKKFTGLKVLRLIINDVFNWHESFIWFSTKYSIYNWNIEYRFYLSYIYY